MEKFCDLILRLRKESGMNINQLATKSGLSTVQIKNLESGKNLPCACTTYKLAKALKCDYRELFEASQRK